MKQLILGIFFSLHSLLALANILVQISSPSINQDDSFTLSLSQENTQNGEIPDLKELQKDFMILGTEQKVSYSFINSQSQSSTRWVLRLKAKKTGILPIPAIKVGQDQSTATSIEVVPSSTSLKPQKNQIQSSNVMLTTQVHEKKTYVNQQIIYTVKLYNNKQLLNANYQGPQVDHALLIPLGKEKRYRTIENDISYVVEEQDYAIFPQKSGLLKIISPIFTALIYDFNPELIKAEDKNIQLKIQPMPSQYQGKTWLPAKEIQLSEHYEQNHQEIDQGSTLTRTVILKGVAVPAQLLPAITFESANQFHVYPEKGIERNQVKQGDLVGSIEMKVTYLFDKAGKVTIPELRLPWFNTRTGREEIAILASRSMNIAATDSSIVNKENQAKVTQQHSSIPSPQTVNKSFDKAWIVAAFFALAWIITLSLWGWQKRPRNLRKREYKKILIKLKTACSKGEPKKARDAILQWAALCWPDAPLLNLADLEKLVKDTSLKKQLFLLSQALYKEKNHSLWHGDELFRAIRSIKQNPEKGKKSDLPPIHLV